MVAFSSLDACGCLWQQCLCFYCDGYIIWMSWLEQKIEPNREIGKPAALSTAYHVELLRELEQNSGEMSVIGM